MEDELASHIRNAIDSLLAAAETDDLFEAVVRLPRDVERLMARWSVEDVQETRDEYVIHMSSNKDAVQLQKVLHAAGHIASVRLRAILLLK